MTELCLPILGFNPERLRDVEVVWADGTPVSGILGNDIREALARCQAEEIEEAAKQELRDSGVVLLNDWRKK